MQCIACSLGQGLGQRHESRIIRQWCHLYLPDTVGEAAVHYKNCLAIQIMFKVFLLLSTHYTGLCLRL